MNALQDIGHNTTEEPIELEDYLVISVAAERARIAIMSEGEAASFFNLLASLGGMFGLFMGLSGVTMFEVIEAHYIVFSKGWGTFRHIQRLTLDYAKKFKIRRSESPDVLEEELHFG